MNNCVIELSLYQAKRLHSETHTQYYFGKSNKIYVGMNN